jgi:hypothetical protein
LSITSFNLGRRVPTPLFLYLVSNDLVIVPFVLCALDRLVIKWPNDEQSLLTGEIVGRLTDVTQNGHKIPDAGNSVFADAVRIWQRWVHCDSPETDKRELLPRLFN